MLLCCQAAGLLPQAVALDVLRRHLAVRLAVASAVRRYVPERSAAPVTLFVAADENRADRTLGWAEWLGPQLRVQTMPGDHRSIVAGPHARSLGRAITAALGAGIGAPQVDAQTGSEI
jgi:thioesterase domain-containing protein